MKSGVLAGFLTLGTTGVALAGSPCDDLSPEARAAADRVLTTAHPYDVCDDTLAGCLKSHPHAPLIRRLADWVCRKAARGGTPEAIARSLEKRALSMMRPGRVHAIALDQAPVAGCNQAAVVVTAYVCARCPYCAKLVPALHREATSGRLAGRVALVFRLFPIKSHEHSTEANLAVGAAQKMGQGWEYLLRAYRGFDEFSPAVLSDWASDVGLDRAAFEDATRDPAVRDAVVASKKEGLRNGVEATPTFFINGRRWQGDLDADTVLDAIEEEAEAVSR